MTDLDKIIGAFRSLAEFAAFVYILVQTTKARAAVTVQQSRLAAGNDAFKDLRTDIQALQIRVERVEARDRPK